MLTLIITYLFLIDPISHCPDTGCNFHDTTYYADYPQDSEEYWREYCNGFIGTKYECK